MTCKISLTIAQEGTDETKATKERSSRTRTCFTSDRGCVLFFASYFPFLFRNAPLETRISILEQGLEPSVSTEASNVSGIFCTTVHPFTP